VNTAHVIMRGVSTRTGQIEARMAEEDPPALTDAINGVLQDHIDGMVTGFCLVAEYIDADGHDAVVWEFAEGQKQSTTLGLLSWARGVAEYEQRRYLDQITGGE
jgi:hypothetical protein